MYERSYGYKYDEPDEHESLAQIAQRMRNDIRQAVSEGLLPGQPVRYSVRTETYSGGGSIDITVQNWHGSFYRADRTHDYPHPDDITPEVEAAKMTLERIHGAYNHDGSDIQTDYFDVRYYGGVRFEDSRAADFRAEQAAKRKARRQAIDELPKQKVRNYTQRGSVVHLAVERNGKLYFVCSGRRAQMFNLRLVDDEITCSRCAKRA